MRECSKASEIRYRQSILKQLCLEETEVVKTIQTASCENAAVSAED